MIVTPSIAICRIRTSSLSGPSWNPCLTVFGAVRLKVATPLYAFMPAEGCVITRFAERLDRELGILDFRFLQAHHIRFVLLEPGQHNREALAQRVYVVGGDLHVAIRLWNGDASILFWVPLELA